MAKKFKLAERWSYSKLSVFEWCPRQFKYRYIDKLSEPEKNWAADRGIIIHAKGEQFLKGNIKGVPKEYEAYKSELRMLKRFKAKPEVDFSFTKDLKPCKWDDWNNVWCISRLDAAATKDDCALIVDYKTGKIYDTHKDQSDLYTFAAFIQYPKIESVSTEFWYLDQPDEDPGIWEYDRDKHFQHLKMMFKKRATKIFTEKSFKCKPSYKCAWCNFNKKKGGPCEN